MVLQICLSVVRFLSGLDVWVTGAESGVMWHLGGEVCWCVWANDDTTSRGTDQIRSTVLKSSTNIQKTDVKMTEIMVWHCGALPLSKQNVRWDPIEWKSAILYWSGRCCKIDVSCDEWEEQDKTRFPFYSSPADKSAVLTSASCCLSAASLKCWWMRSLLHTHLCTHTHTDTLVHTH